MFAVGTVPYPSLRNENVVQFLKEEKRMEAPDFCPENVYEVMLECWNTDPNLRPSMDELYHKLIVVKESVICPPVSI